MNFIKFETEKIDECIDFIRSLIDARKCSINQRLDSTANNNGDGRIVLQAAAEGGHLVIIKRLL